MGLSGGPPADPAGGLPRPAYARSDPAGAEARSFAKEAFGRNGSWTAVARSASPWNILLISLDTTRRDRLSCYGFTRPTSPNLDRLAQDGILFENPVSPIPVTLPAHASMFTGLYPFQHGVRNNGFYVAPDSLVTLAELLRDRGYATGAVLASFTLERRFGLAQGFGEYEDRFGNQGTRGVLDLAQRPAAEITPLALAWVDAHRDRPFFLFAHYFDPHAPYRPPEPFRSSFAGDLYAGEIAAMDAAIGELIEGLRSRGLLEQTVVLVAGDHGEGLGDHGEQTHTTFIYQSTQSVPLLARFPRAAPFDGAKWRARRVRELVSLVDLMPTAWNALGFPREDLPLSAGRSLLPVILGEDAGHPWVYCETLVPDLEYGASELRGLITADGWKYIRAPRAELYNLTADPGEETNRFGQDGERERRMESDLAALLQAEPGGGAAARAVDRETLERLRSLGYIGGGATGATGSPKPDPKDLRWVQRFVAQAEAMTAMFQPAEALRLVDSVLAVYPGTRVALRDRASFLHSLERNVEAVRAYDLALQNCGDCPEESQLRQDRAIAASAAGQHDLALREVRELIGRQPQGAGLHQLLGEILQATGDTTGARRAFEDESRLFPGDPLPHLAIGRLALSRNRTAEAESAFRRAIVAHPNSADAIVTLSDLLSQTKRMEEAELLVDRALALQPAHPQGNAQKGYICSATRRYDLAVQHYTRALESRPKHAATLANLGAVYLNSGQKDKAFATLQACLETGEAPQSAYANLGICHAERGDLRQAVALWEKGLKLDPKSDAAAAIQQNLARARGLMEGAPKAPGSGK
jgi:arylsulfatase A-like enzyme/Flp pilus assembly protein TadD